MRDAIYQRISTRTYKKQRLTKQEIKSIQDILKRYNKVKGPFNNSFEFTFNLTETKNPIGNKMGTYGLLKNVGAYIGGTCNNDRNAIIDFGYVLEKIILELTKLGFATCWLGGTFKRKDYRRKLSKNEIIPAITPVGFRAERRSIIDRSLRSAAQSHRRIPFTELFGYYDANLPLKENADSRFIDILKLVRSGPSASNKQPWRIYSTQNHDEIHVFLKRNNGYGKVLNYDIQALDIGIALSHLEIGLDHYEFEYTKEVLKEVEMKGYEYIITYKKANQ